MLEDLRWAVEFWKKGIDGGNAQFFDDQQLAREYFNSLDAKESDLNLSDVIDFIAKFRPMYSFSKAFIIDNNINSNFRASSDQIGCDPIDSEDLWGIVSRLLDRHDEEEILFAHRIGFIE